MAGWMMLVAAAALPAPHHVSAGIAIHPHEGRLDADVIVFPGPVAAGGEIAYLLGEHFTVHVADAGPHSEIQVAPAETPWPGIQRISVRFSEAQETPQLRVRYSGRPNPAGNLPINLIGPDLVELSLDGMWLPTRDDLSGRFTVEARVSLPQQFDLVAQGEISRSGDTFHIRRTLPELDFALVAMPGLRSVGDQRLRFHARDPESEQARLFRRQADSALRFLEGWFGPIPGAPMRLVLVSRPRQSGYARSGYFVFVESETASEPGTGHFVAHEFAHAWFSSANAATEHRWLDESTAEYVAMRYGEEAFGRERFEALIAARRKSAEGAQPILGGVRTDRELYAKGPLLLYDLERMLGRDRFDLLLARVARERIGTTDSFLRILAHFAGSEAASRFDAMLRR